MARTAHHTSHKADGPMTIDSLIKNLIKRRDSKSVLYGIGILFERPVLSSNALLPVKIMTTLGSNYLMFMNTIIIKNLQNGSITTDFSMIKFKSNARISSIEA